MRLEFVYASNWNAALTHTDYLVRGVSLICSHRGALIRMLCLSVCLTSLARTNTKAFEYFVCVCLKYDICYVKPRGKCIKHERPPIIMQSPQGGSNHIKSAFLSLQMSNILLWMEGRFSYFLSEKDSSLRLGDSTHQDVLRDACALTWHFWTSGDQLLCVYESECVQYERRLG